MASRRSVKADATAVASQPEQPEQSEEQRKALLEQAIQQRVKIAESNLDMAKMFIQNNKFDIARRRLRQLVDEFDGSPAATEAQAMLKTLKR